MVFAIQMLLDYTYRLLNLLEYKCNHFNNLSLAESKFKNSNVGGKQLELMSWLRSQEKSTLVKSYMSGERNEKNSIFFQHFSSEFT